MEQNTDVHRILLENLKRKRHVGCYGNWIGMAEGVCGTDSPDGDKQKQRTVVKHGKDPSVSRKNGEILV
jgi:hypothetical protein